MLTLAILIIIGLSLVVAYQRIRLRATNHELNKTIQDYDDLYYEGLNWYNTAHTLADDLEEVTGIYVLER